MIEYKTLNEFATNLTVPKELHQMLTAPLEPLVEHYGSNLMELAGGSFFVLETDEEIAKVVVNTMMGEEDTNLKDCVGTPLFDAMWVYYPWCAVLTVNNNAGGPTYIFQSDKIEINQKLKKALEQLT
jgi:hypothetical protein